MENIRVNSKQYLALYLFLVSQSICLTEARNTFGPQVDPGVFVITHIDSCRNGAGYCILGFSCEVDKDFTKDDLGGHCRGLSKAFNPRASFVCCRETPKTNDANSSPASLQHIIDAGYSEGQNTIKTTSVEVTSTSTTPISIPVPLDLSTSSSMQIKDSALPSTTTLKEIEAVNTLTVGSKIETTDDENVSYFIVGQDGEHTFTEEVMVLSVDTEMNDLKEKEQMRPGIVLDGEPPISKASMSQKYMAKNESSNTQSAQNLNENSKPSINCFTAILLGIKCEINGIDGGNTNNAAQNPIIPLKILGAIDSQKENTEFKDKENISKTTGEILETNDNEKIVTVNAGLLPDRDEVFLKKPLIISQAVPVPLEVIKDGNINEHSESDDRNVIASSTTSFEVTPEVKLPSAPLPSPIAESIIPLNDTKEEQVGFIASAKPLSVMLSSNKIHVSLNTSTNLDSDKDLLLHSNSTTENYLVRNTTLLSTGIKLPSSSESTIDLNSKVILSNSQNKTSHQDSGEEIKSSGYKSDETSSNWVEIKPDLLKEPRIEKEETLKEDDTDKNKLNVSGAPISQDMIQKKDKTNIPSHVIPTFYNPKIQAIYTSDNTSVTSNSSKTSTSIPESTKGNLSTSNDTKIPINGDIIDLQHTNSSSQISEPDSSSKIHESTTSYLFPQNPTCGKLGGAAIFQVFGKLSQKLMPNLVANWVTGQNGQHQKNQRAADKRARLDLSGEFDKDGTHPRIIAGDVTSTIMYCWMAAIVEVLPDGQGNKFVCTGALVTQDLVLTSASCTHRLFERGSHHFNVVLGDANLNIDLPFGVQNHEISEVIVHENYRPEDKYHHEDIGLIRLKTYAKLQNTICLLCLPERSKDYALQNCTVTGYGKPSITALNSVEVTSKENINEVTDGILRKADLPIVQNNQCRQYLDMTSDNKSKSAYSGFLCAGGVGDEESCYVALDGGSPLACQTDKEGNYELAGIVTFGTSCSQDRSPSLFTNVSKYLKWISQNYKKTRKR